MDSSFGSNPTAPCPGRGTPRGRAAGPSTSRGRRRSRLGNQRAPSLGSPSLSLVDMAGLRIHDQPRPPLLDRFSNPLRVPNAQCYPRGRMAEVDPPRSSFADRPPWNGRQSWSCYGHRGVPGARQLYWAGGDGQETPLHDGLRPGFDRPFYYPPDADRYFPTDRPVPEMPTFWNPTCPSYMLPSTHRRGTVLLTTPPRPYDQWSVFGHRFSGTQIHGTGMTRGHRGQQNVGSFRGHGSRKGRGSSSGSVPSFSSYGQASDQGNYYPFASEQNFYVDSWDAKNYTSFEDQSK